MPSTCPCCSTNSLSLADISQRSVKPSAPWWPATYLFFIALCNAVFRILTTCFFCIPSGPYRPLSLSSLFTREQIEAAAWATHWQAALVIFLHEVSLLKQANMVGTVKIKRTAMSWHPVQLAYCSSWQGCHVTQAQRNPPSAWANVRMKQQQQQQQQRVKLSQADLSNKENDDAAGCEK